MMPYYPNMYQQPIIPQPQPQSPFGIQPQRQEIVRVTGENGARTFQMAPNSSVLLLDDTSPIIWVVQTDGAGYKTVTPYKISPYQPEPQIDVRSLDERIRRLEETINAKPNSGDSKQKQNLGNGGSA